MLKITPYLGILLVIVAVGGLWYPLLGYFMLVVFATLLIIAPFKGRWFCGNLCPRGSFNDFWLSKITMGKKIPKFFRNMYFRAVLFLLLMGGMVYRLLGTSGLVKQIGMVFVIMCLVTTLISVLFGVFLSPRTWCTFCPMGTIQRVIGGKKYILEVDKSKCIDCGLCNKVCPMHLSVNSILAKPDCIKCGRCIEVCPKTALYFKR